VRIFVGYHYNRRDEWVEQYVFPLVQAFGDEVVTGKHVVGPLGEAIMKKISDCEAMIGVASRRNRLSNDPSRDDVFDTHVWVQQELHEARTKDKLWIQLRETKIDPQFGTLTGTRYIDYDIGGLPQCLVDLARVLGEWHLQQDANIHLRPDAFTAAVTPLVFNVGLIVRFTLFDRDYEPREQGITSIVPSEGALRVKLRRVPRDNFIQLSVTHGARHWKSDYIRVDSPVAIMNLVKSP